VKEGERATEGEGGNKSLLRRSAKPPSVEGS